MPTVDMGNKALPADKKLTAVVKSEVDTKSVEALPGQTSVWTWQRSRATTGLRCR